MTGRVYLVGAGPGDAGLITTRGRRLLESADAVVYDRLISPRLLDYVPAGAELLYVGKSAGHHALVQSDIQSALVELAGRCQTVVRLKGGDPFVFGRGGEEADWLRRHGVSYEVVPGVTSAVAVPAYAGIPLTQRGVSTGFAVVTGQTGDPSDLDVTASADLLLHGGTLVVLMGMGRMTEIAAGLQARGVAGDLPAAVIEWGTRAAQRSVQSTLTALPETVAAAGLCAPAVIVIGHVAGFADDLAWLAERPLSGRVIALAVETECEAVAAGEQLEALGAEFVTFVAARQAVTDTALLEADLQRVRHRAVRGSVGSGRDGGLTFACGIDAALFLRHFFAAGEDIRALAGVRLTVESEAARCVLQNFGLHPDAYVDKVAVGTGGPRYASGFTVPGHVRDLINSGSVGVDAVWASSEWAWAALQSGLSTAPGQQLPQQQPLWPTLALYGCKIEPPAGAIGSGGRTSQSWAQTARVVAGGSGRTP